MSGSLEEEYFVSNNSSGDRDRASLSCFTVIKFEDKNTSRRVEKRTFGISLVNELQAKSRKFFLDNNTLSR